MCISPIMLETGYLVGCRNCWQCRSTRVDAWVGRNIAETETATVSYAVTLTYGRDWDGRSDHVQSVQLMYSDCQKLLKRMRKAGQQVRYILAGEYGSAMGRAHWHGIFHFYGETLPDWEGKHLEWDQERWDRVGGIHIPEWAINGVPLGHVHIKKATYAHTRYALKYLMKDEGDPHKQTIVHMSRKPPLGYAYFMQLADQTAQAGLVIEDLKYRFNVRTRSGEERIMPFLITGRMAEMYLARYIDSWRRIHGNNRWPDSEVVDNYAQFGRLGNEDAMTEARTSEMPSEYAYRHGEYKLRAVGQASDVERALYPQFAGGKRRAETLAEYSTRRNDEFRMQRVRERNEAKKNDKTWQQGQRERIKRERAEAVRVCIERCGITQREYEKLPKSWQRFLVASARDSQSLFAAGRRDYDAGRGSEVPQRTDQLRGWF